MSRRRSLVVLRVQPTTRIIYPNYSGLVADAHLFLWLCDRDNPHRSCKVVQSRAKSRPLSDLGRNTAEMTLSKALLIAFHVLSTVPMTDSLDRRPLQFLISFRHWRPSMNHGTQFQYTFCIALH